MPTITTLARLIERTTGLPSVQPTATPVAERPGYMKVRLTYLTNEPKHYRSYQLAMMYGLAGPFTEEAYVLMPAYAITSMDLTMFRSAFAFLQRNFVVSRTARLVKVTLLDEDTSTLAYVCK
jgi:hypothetical protein